jgi:hypothetical protein
MKWLVWLLVLGNLVLLAYFNIDLIAPMPVTANKAISPEKLKILSQIELDAMPKKVVDVVPVAAELPIAETSCYEWGNFTASNLPSAQVALVKLNLKAEIKQAATPQADRRFWVYYPPLKNAQLALDKAEEIRAFGVGELFIVQDSQWRNAISFGLFQDEQLATNLLNDLKAKGVKGATKALRSPGKNISSLLIKEVTPDLALALQKITPEFLGSELKPAVCP